MSEHAVLNANYLRHAIHREAKSAGVDHMFVDGAETVVAKHEFTLSLAPAKESLGISAMDVAKGCSIWDTWLQRCISHWSFQNV